MPWGLKRFQNTGQSHFVTFSCYHRQPLFAPERNRRVFEQALERVRRLFDLQVYAYVVMPEHVHLLLSEPKQNTLADVLKSLKQGVSRRLIGEAERFWQKRYYDFNIRNHPQFVEKLHYIHTNPVKRGLCARPEDWEQLPPPRKPARRESCKSNRNGQLASANERKESCVLPCHCPTQAKRRLEWGTR